MSRLATCSSCQHWIPQRANGGAIVSDTGIPGECHCHPPSAHLLATPQGVTTITTFPLPHSSMWCGEYQPKDAEEKG